MVYSLKPRRKARKARRNPSKYVFGVSFPKKKKSSKRSAKKTTRKAIRKATTGWHRPRLLKTKRGWFRPKRRSMLAHGTRINPKRSHRRHTRRNPGFKLPKLPFHMDTVLMGGVKIAGGIALGVFAMPQVAKLAAIVDKQGKFLKFYGIVHVVLGAVAASMVKKPIVRDMALTFAGVGVYDLLAHNLPMLRLPLLDGGVSQAVAGGYEPALLGEEQPGVVGADDEPALMGASYMGASYMGKDDIAYGGDTDSLDC